MKREITLIISTTIFLIGLILLVPDRATMGMNPIFFIAATTILFYGFLRLFLAKTFTSPKTFKERMLGVKEGKPSEAK